MKLISNIIVLTIIGTVICDRDLIIKNIRPELCDLATLHTLEVIQAYFWNQEVLTVVIHEGNKTASSMENVLLMCIVTRLDKPLYHYYNSRELQIHHPIEVTKSTDTLSVTSCYIVCGDTYADVSEDLLNLSKINPTAKYIFVLRNSSVSEGEQVLQAAWHSYKMLRMLVILVSAEGEARQLNVVIYNPFVCHDRKCSERGNFSNFHITNDNFNTTINEIMRMMNYQDDNLHKYPLRIYMYEWKSFARAVLNPRNKSEIIRFRLLDGEILTLLSRRMNFKMVFVGELKTNSVAGSKRAIDQEEADIAANSRIISDSRSNNTVFITQMYRISLKYIVPKQYTNKILNVFIYSMFDWNTEVIMIAVFIILILVWYLLNYFHEQFTRQSESNSIPRALIIVTASQYFISIKFSKFLKGHQQILLGSMLLYSIVVSSNFQSSIVKQLATEVEDRDINTLNQLAESSHAIWYVQTLRDFLKIPDNLPESSTLYKLYKKQTALRDSIDDRVLEIAYNKTIAILCTQLVAEEFASQYLDEVNGRPLLHVARQPLAEFYYSYIVPKTSPYRLRINEIILRAIEGGILEHEQKLVERRTKLNAIRAIIRFGRNKLSGGSNGYKGVTIEQIKTLFVVWGYMLTLASFVFIIELSVFYLYPQYQKYHDKHDL